MFALSKLASGVSAALQPRIPAVARLGQSSFYSSNSKTSALKAKEKAKRRRMRINKADKPAQAKRGA
ncbi:hypothetical protein EV175_003126, partial [Coemansia sp. RSA 1933]